MTALAGVRKLRERVLRRVSGDLIGPRSLQHPLERRRRLLRTLKVELVIDVGAHEGEYGSELRRIGYRGKILSFEPLTEPFRRLAARARTDPQWDAIQSAIGPSPGHAQLNVAANRGASSSFLPMLQAHVDDAPEARYVGTESVVVTRLDEACTEAMLRAGPTFLKIDVQGFELQVLESATGIMPWIVGLQLEMSLIPLYSGAPAYMTLLELTQGMGFKLVGVEPVFVGADGRLLQADGLFERAS